MEPEDFGAVECLHWRSADEVRAYIEEQGIASMLAFDGERCVGQLYLKAYEPGFREPGGWAGNRPWSDFTLAEPLPVSGRHLTLGCYHVGRLADGSHDPSRWGRGIAGTLLETTIEWQRRQQEVDGLLAWGLVPGSRALLEWGGQLPYTRYLESGFQEIAKVRDPRLEPFLEGVDTAGAREDPLLLRVMRLETA
jgi:hypothetical protein